jgi:hypothetical protein
LLQPSEYCLWNRLRLALLNAGRVVCCLDARGGPASSFPFSFSRRRYRCAAVSCADLFCVILICVSSTHTTVVVNILNLLLFWSQKISGQRQHPLEGQRRRRILLSENVLSCVGSRVHVLSSGGGLCFNLQPALYCPMTIVLSWELS